MSNRLQRDQIVIAALDAVDSPSLDQKERPGGTLTGTLGVGWLQRALDFFYKVFPIKGAFASTTITLTAGVSTFTLPADYLLDFQNGIRLRTREGVNIQARLWRRSYSALLSRDILTLGFPRNYAIVSDTQGLVRPVPDVVYTGDFFYYKLPPSLGVTDIPPFPDDQVLVDFLEVRYKEWLQMVPKGSAIRYMKEAVALLQKSGIGPEPEPDQIELDRQYYGDQGQGDNFNDWMGKTSL